MEMVRITLTCPYCGYDKFTDTKSGTYKCVQCGQEEHPENMTTKTVKIQVQDYPKGFTETTEIVCYRQDNSPPENFPCVFGPVYVVHKPGNVLEMIEECCKYWFQTKEGAEAYKASCRDFNMGDWLNGCRPDDDFTKNFGFIYTEFSPRTADSIHLHKILLHHDRLLVSEPKHSNEGE